ncbi:ATP-dependent helicase [Faecalimonas sp.]
MGFNKAQIEAITHHDGPMLVLAGPGSGKTLVITRRIEYLIQKRKVRPEEILVITFTKAATNEMRERFKKVMQGRYLPVTFGTFHGIYYGILKWAYKLSTDNIFSEEEKTRLLKEILEHIDAEIDIEDENDFLEGIRGEISCIKNNQLNISEFQSAYCAQTVFKEIYYTYERERNRRKKLDFDDMLVLCYELFTKRPDILKKWQERYSYILIDEFQDINKVQYDVIRMLALPQNNLFIVGDDDQSIYKFRGARPEIMLGFEKDYPDAKKVLLDVNYRCTKAIVNGAKKIIQKNKNRYAKNLITSNEQGADIHIQEVRNLSEESIYVLNEIREEMNRGVPATEIAVLFRTNMEPRMLAETFMEYNLPFQMKEHLPNLYEHFICKNFCAYLRMAVGKKERKDFLEVMNRPIRYISRSSVEKAEVSFEDLRKFYCDKEWMLDRIDQLDVDLRIMKNMTPYAAIQYIRKKIGYDDFLKDYAYTRKIKVEDLYEVANDLQTKAKKYKTIKEWFAHIENYTAELKNRAKQTEENKNAVTFLTMHSAKGLEFHTVFIIEANEDICPYKKAEIVEDMEEERRMFYVAMTRAKKKLYISYVKERNGKAMVPSRFVNDLLFE